MVCIFGTRGEVTVYLVRLENRCSRVMMIRGSPKAASEHTEWSGTKILPLLPSKLSNQFHQHPFLVSISFFV